MVCVVWSESGCAHLWRVVDFGGGVVLHERAFIVFVLGSVGVMRELGGFILGSYRV